MIQTLLAQVGLPLLLNVLAEALNAVDTPVTKGAANALGRVDEAIRAGQISEAQVMEVHRHAEKMAELKY